MLTVVVSSSKSRRFRAAADTTKSAATYTYGAFFAHVLASGTVWQPRVGDLHAYRYDQGYPHAPVSLKVERTDGLSPADRRAMSKLLHASAEAMARKDAVCGFDLVDASQDFLRDRNDTPYQTDAVSKLAYAGCMLSRCVQHPCSLTSPN